MRHRQLLKTMLAGTARHEAKGPKVVSIAWVFYLRLPQWPWSCTEDKSVDVWDAMVRTWLLMAACVINGRHARGTKS